MPSWIEERAAKYREFFKLDQTAEITPNGAHEFEINPEIAKSLEHFNIEWHFIPAETIVSFNDDYLTRFYPTAKALRNKGQRTEKSVYTQLVKGHARQQGYIVGVETTQKPGYLPRNRQFYGTSYGHDASVDPLAPYFGLVGMTGGTRFDQNYPMLRKLFDTLNEDWRERRRILPPGYRVTVCPPGIFNLIGTVFHPEWSETESLELGFYRDERGNASCFAVGPNAPGDFSYIDVIEGEEWSLTGFRLALLPDQTRFDAKSETRPK